MEDENFQQELNNLADAMKKGVAPTKTSHFERRFKTEAWNDKAQLAKEVSEFINKSAEKVRISGFAYKAVKMSMDFIPTRDQLLRDSVKKGEQNES
jgi:hypothetical protein